MGADARLFDAQRRAFPNLRILEWQRPRRGDTFADYARRMAEKLPAGELVLGGVSFGGVIAQEIAAIRKPAALLLISTLTSTRDLRGGLAISRWLPATVLAEGARMARGVCRLSAATHGLLGQHRGLIATMLGDADAGYLAWACSELPRWEAPLLPAIPTLRVHGTRDPLLLPADRSGIRWIRGAGHLASMTHGAEVNRAIAEFLGRLP